MATSGKEETFVAYSSRLYSLHKIGTYIISADIYVKSETCQHADAFDFYLQNINSEGLKSHSAVESNSLAAIYSGVEQVNAGERRSGPLG
ncbi:hypothetical protein V6N13_075316 [Hibiscus sabdariffa]